MNWLRRKWYARLRRIDIEILWPQCKQLAPDIDRARAAFAFHALNDDAWLCLGLDGASEAIEALR